MNRGCTCRATAHETRLVVLTGGPGAGKTAVLELVRRTLCEHVVVLPEAATILFAGGFPRRSAGTARRAAQRAIYHVQRELESIAMADGAAVALCDRGTLDGLAYWPGPPEEYLAGLRTTRELEMARYGAVLHLRVPAPPGYNHANVVRIEDAREAAAIDQRIEDAWAGHPRRFFVESAPDFLEKANRAIKLLLAELPVCCRPPP